MVCPRCKNRTLRKGSKSPGGKQRWICRAGGGDRETCYSTTDPLSPPRNSRGLTTAPTPVYKRDLAPVQRYIITAAQNLTPVHRKFFASLLRAKRYLKAELLVIPIRYKNPTSAFDKDQEVWGRDVTPYLWSVRKALNPNLVVLADIKTQPTASEPLTGFESITMGESGILGHTKVQTRTIPTPSHRYPKLLMTTGACTLPNYSDTKAGKKGEFHHVLGAVLVEIQGKAFHVRRLLGNKTTGEFTDLDMTYTPTGRRKAERPLALVMGDTHVDSIDPKVERATFGPGGIVDTLNPRALVWHDVLDAYSVNPHHKNNPFVAAAKRFSGKDEVRLEVQRAVDFVCARTTGDRQSIIVGSNHNDFVSRYMKSQDWREDVTNSKFYLETALHLVDNLSIGPGGLEMPDPFAYWFKKLAHGDDKNVRILRRDESYTRGGVEMGFHGDQGPNGSMGSARNLRRVGVRSIIGHSHSPCEEEGCVQVGTSTSLRLEYTSGPSSWLNSHCILHSDGKRQLIHIIDGNWRL
jgi:hypothetical protein